MAGTDTQYVSTGFLVCTRVCLCAYSVFRVREAIERLHEHMRKDIKTNTRCQSTRLTRPYREKVTTATVTNAAAITIITIATLCSEKNTLMFPLISAWKVFRFTQNFH